MKFETHEYSSNNNDIKIKINIIINTENQSIKQFNISVEGFSEYINHRNNSLSIKFIKSYLIKYDLIDYGSIIEWVIDLTTPLHIKREEIISKLISDL